MLSSDSTEPLNSDHKQKLIDDKSKSVYFLADEQHEIDRLRTQYEILKKIFGGIFNAPVHKELEDGIAVFDSGCGPGQWVTEMSKKYPRSTFVGFDLSDNFPLQDSRPPNCEFTIHSILNPLPFSDSHFGFIHQQYLTLGIPDNQWSSVLRDFARTLKPGGWIELTEPMMTELVNAGPKVSAFFSSFLGVMTKKGVASPTAQKLESHLTDAGFINISVTRGLKAMVDRDGDLETNKRKFLEGFGPILEPSIVRNYPELRDPTAFSSFVTETIEECLDLNSSIPVYRIYGQKMQ